MIKLNKATVFKYKSILQTQAVAIDSSITTIVGMNESGKTSFLEALAKTNYFNDDKDFKYDVVHDYPRSEYVDFQNSKAKQDIISCEYDISQDLIDIVAQDLGKDVFNVKKFEHVSTYNTDSKTFNGVVANQKKYLENKLSSCILSAETRAEIEKIETLKDITSVAEKEGDTGLSALKAEVNKIISENTDNYTNPIEGYIIVKYLKPKMPKFWYFDEYYDLPGKININKLSFDNPATESDKTAKALFELAGIKPTDILNTKEYERFIALLEASSIKITKEIFNYWSTNQNLDIEFKIQDIPTPQPPHNEKCLDIRVKSQRHKISLPLDRRSKGFNWFFSFIVWFNKIQGDKNSNYVLLLDEPGLNLHASAQADLLRFIENLAKKYQIIYTTHSPFMVDPSHLDRVRTCLETQEGTVISETIKEKDSSTLFPLQAALGYDIAQNLFISKNNLLVEGPADLVYLTVMSTILESQGRTGLNDQITIVPVGGLDKVATFIALLKASKLNIACLLDTFVDQKGKQRVDDLVKNKIIKEKAIRFFHEFAGNGRPIADIEDVFAPEDYIKLFNEAFGSNLKVSDLDATKVTIVQQLNTAIQKDRFNHYRPANKLSQLGVDATFFSASTLDNFEKLFKEVNKVMGLAGDKVEVNPTFN